MKKSFSNFGELLYSALHRIGGFLANVGIFGMTILVVANALSRYLFRWTPAWGDEICEYLIIFTVFLGAGMALKEDRHIRITALFNRTSPRGQQILQMIYGLIALFFIGYVTYSLFELSMMSFQIGSKSMGGMPLFPLQILLTLGLFILLISLAGFTLKRIIWVVHPRKR